MKSIPKNKLPKELEGHIEICGRCGKRMKRVKVRCSPLDDNRIWLDYKCMNCGAEAIYFSRTPCRAIARKPK